MVRRIVPTLVLAALASQALTLSALGAAASGPQGAAVVAEVVDTIAPTQPGNLRLVSRTRSGSITLGWVASSDDVGVAGYRMYKNRSWAGTLSQAGVNLLGTVWYDRLGGKPKAAVTYDLYAFDAAGNVSAPATLVVTP